MSRQDSRKGRAPVLALLLALAPMASTAWAAEHEVQILKYVHAGRSHDQARRHRPG